MEGDRLRMGEKIASEEESVGAEQGLSRRRGRSRRVISRVMSAVTDAPCGDQEGGYTELGAKRKEECDSAGVGVKKVREGAEYITARQQESGRRGRKKQSRRGPRGVDGYSI